MSSIHLKNLSCVAGLSLVYLVLASSCAEKPASTASTPTKTGTATNTGTGDDDDSTITKPGDDDDDAVDPSKPFDLCTDGLVAKKATIAGFDTYIEELCGSGKRIAQLRTTEFTYTGGEPKLVKAKDSSSDTTVSVRLFTSTLADAKASDYFALIKLQVSKPAVYHEHGYASDPNVTLSQVEASDTQSNFHYVFDDGDGHVEYTATTHFYELKRGIAYVSATSLDAPGDNMKALKGMIIINRKDATHSEVFTMSDQTLALQSQTAATIESKSMTKAGNEQKNMFENAKKAKDAPGLLK